MIRNTLEYGLDAVLSTQPAVLAAGQAFGAAWTKDMNARAVQRAIRRTVDMKVKEMRMAAEAELSTKYEAAAA
jgi:hypothetical protein